MPTNIVIKYADLPNGLRYFYQHWMPDKPRALVVFVHGLGDHIGRYSDLILRLSRDNYACALYDQRGHGKSGGKRGHADHFEDWVSDLAGFVQFSQMAVPAGTPLILVGYSLGALIGINFLLIHSTSVAGMVTLSAAVIPTLRIPQWKRKLATRIAGFYPKFSISADVKFEDLTSDPEQLELLRNDPFFHRRITVGAGLEIERNLELVMAMPHRIHMPMLMLAGGEDCVCDPDGTKQFAMRLSSADRRYHIYPEMRHDLLHDTGRGEVLEDVVGWINEKSVRAAEAGRQHTLKGEEAIWQDASSQPAS